MSQYLVDRMSSFSLYIIEHVDLENEVLDQNLKKYYSHDINSLFTVVGELLFVLLVLISFLSRSLPDCKPMLCTSGYIFPLYTNVTYHYR